MGSATDMQDEAPGFAFGNGQIHYGRYRQPIARPNIRAPGRAGRFRLKQWHYSSVVTEECFFAFGLVQLGYLANAFCYFVDRQSLWRRHELEAIAPLGLGLRMAPSSVDGVTEWRWRGSRIRVGWNEGWDVELDVQLSGEGLRGAIRIEPGQCLALLHPLGRNRPAYTHKAAALKTSGALRFLGKRYECDEGLGAIDWTRSVARRLTTWKWASFGTRLEDGRRLGLNLSAEVYDDHHGHSRENGLWLDGKVMPLRGVVFEVPREPARLPWHIRGAEPDQLELRFQPEGARAQNLDIKLIRSEFVQPYGTFSGWIRDPSTGEKLAVDQAFGVVESHISLW